jgi:hypothetical protein
MKVSVLWTELPFDTGLTALYNVFIGECHLQFHLVDDSLLDLDTSGDNRFVKSDNGV